MTPNLRLALSVIGVLAGGSARAQEAGGARAEAARPSFQAFSSTNLQLLQGWTFDSILDSNFKGHLKPSGGKPGKVYAGVEWWLHSYDVGSFDRFSSAPQAMVQWTVY